MSRAGAPIAAMIAIENSVEGGVSATQDALATVPGLRIVGEYLVPVNFVLVARPGTTLAEVRIVNAHPVAYAQSRGWLERELPDHGAHPRDEQRAGRGIPLRRQPGGCRGRAARHHRPPRPRRARPRHRRQPQRRHPVRARLALAGARGAHGRRQDEPDRRAARRRARIAARDARAVLDPGREPVAARVASDRRRARPLPLRGRPRRAHRRRARRRRPARPAPHEPERDLPRLVPARRPARDRVPLEVRRRDLHRGARLAARDSSAASPTEPTRS